MVYICQHTLTHTNTASDREVVELQSGHMLLFANMWSLDKSSRIQISSTDQELLHCSQCLQLQKEVDSML